MAYFTTKLSDIVPGIDDTNPTRHLVQPAQQPSASQQIESSLMSRNDREYLDQLRRAHVPKGRPHLMGAVKSTALEALGGLGGLLEIPGEVISPLKQAGENVRNFYSQIADEDPDVQEYTKSVIEGREPWVGEFAGSLGPTGMAALLHTVPLAGRALATAYFYKLNKEEAEQLALDKGADPQRALWTGRVAGAINSALDIWGLDRIFAASQPAKNIGRFLLNLGMAGVSEGATEGLQEVISDMSSEFAAKPPEQDFGEFISGMEQRLPTFYNRFKEAALIGGPMGALFGGAAGGAAALQRRGRAKEAERQRVQTEQEAQERAQEAAQDQKRTNIADAVQMALVAEPGGPRDFILKGALIPAMTEQTGPATPAQRRALPEPQRALPEPQRMLPHSTIPPIEAGPFPLVPTEPRRPTEAPTTVLPIGEEAVEAGPYPIVPTEGPRTDIGRAGLARRVQQVAGIGEPTGEVIEMAQPAEEEAFEPVEPTVEVGEAAEVPELTKEEVDLKEAFRKAQEKAAAAEPKPERERTRFDDIADELGITYDGPHQGLEQFTTDSGYTFSLPPGQVTITSVRKAMPEDERPDFVPGPEREGAEPLEFTEPKLPADVHGIVMADPVDPDRQVFYRREQAGFLPEYDTDDADAAELLGKRIALKRGVGRPHKYGNLIRILERKGIPYRLLGKDETEDFSDKRISGIGSIDYIQDEYAVKYQGINEDGTRRWTYEGQVEEIAGKEFTTKGLDEDEVAAEIGKLEDEYIAEQTEAEEALPPEEEVEVEEEPEGETPPKEPKPEPTAEAKPDKEATLKILRRRQEDWNKQALKYEGGKGIPVGAEGVQYRWASDAMIIMQKAVEAGKTIDEAATEAKATARGWIEKHNARRPKDINWKRWEGAADTYIDDAVREVKRLEPEAITEEPEEVTEEAPEVREVAPEDVVNDAMKRVQEAAENAGADYSNTPMIEKAKIADVLWANTILTEIEDAAGNEYFSDGHWAIKKDQKKAYTPLQKRADKVKSIQPYRGEMKVKLEDIISTENNLPLTYVGTTQEENADPQAWYVDGMGNLRAINENIGTFFKSRIGALNFRGDPAKDISFNMYAGDELVGVIMPMRAPFPVEEVQLPEGAEIEEPEIEKGEAAEGEKPKKKKRKGRWTDTGREIHGKRASKDKSERIEAINVELDSNIDEKADPEAFLKAINKLTNKSKILKLDLPEGATPGTLRFLKTFRNKINGFNRWAAKEYKNWQDSTDKGAILRHLEANPEYQVNVKNQASEYIATLELLEEAIEETSTVQEARDKLWELFVEDPAIDKMRKVYPSRFKFTPFGESIVGMFAQAFPGADQWTRSSRNAFKWTFGKHADSEMADEEGADRNQAFEHRPGRRFNFMDIEDDPNKYRNGKDVDPKTLEKVFGFTGIKWGNWVSGREQQHVANLFYDGFHELMKAIGGAPARAISVPATDPALAIGFGGWGRGGRTAAHYQPSDHFIHLTKTKGDGSVSHEWAHSWDKGSKIDMSNNKDESLRDIDPLKDIKIALRTKYNFEAIREEAYQLLKGLHHETRQSRKNRVDKAKAWLRSHWKQISEEETQFYRDAKKLDAGKDPYYRTEVEMFARAFESWIADKIGSDALFIVDPEFVSGSYIKDHFNWDVDAYPSGEERERLNSLFENLFRNITWDKNGIPTVGPDFVPLFINTQREVEAELEKFLEKLDEIYNAIYGGKPSNDGLYWYAYLDTSRAPGMQPSGMVAYDDKYKVAEQIEEHEERGGIGAIGYSGPLIADDVVEMGLVPINHDKNDDTLYLGGANGQTSENWTDGNGALGEVSSQDGKQFEEKGTIVTDPEASGRSLGEGDDGLGINEGGESSDSGGTDESGADISAGGTRADPGNGPGADPARINEDYAIGPRDYIDADLDQVRTFTNAISAIRILKEVEEGRYPATEGEQRILQAFPGWQAIKAELDRYSYGAIQNRHDMISGMLSRSEMNSARKFKNDSHATPLPVIDAIWETLQRFGFTSGRILDFAMGKGSIFGAMPKSMRKTSVLTGIEPDQIQRRIAKKLYPNQYITDTRFEETPLANNYFDLVFTDMPHTANRLSKPDPEHNPLGWESDPHWLNKAINHTREGGLIVAIAETELMDAPNNADARKNIGDKVDFLGAIRLPKQLYGDMSKDVIFLRKKGGGGVEIKKKAWEKVNAGARIPVNEYFVENPQMVLGQLELDNDPISYRITKYALSQDKADNVEREINDLATTDLPINIYFEEIPGTEIDLLKTIPEPDFVKDGAFVIEGKKLYQSIGGKPVEVKDSPRIRGMVGMRGTIRGLLRSYAAGETKAKTEKWRKALNKQYDEFVKKFGFVNAVPNVKAFIQDPDAPLLLTLERWDHERQKSLGKTAIFEPGFFKPVTPPTSAKNSSEALNLSLAWKSRIDFPWMTRLSGVPRDQLISELKGKIYDDPEVGWVTADEYLSGNVKHKLRVAQKMAEVNKKQYGPNVRALKKVIPADLQSHEINVRLGAAWVPPKVIGEFMKDLTFEYNVKAEYSPVLGKWQIKFTGASKAAAKRNKDSAVRSTEATSEWGTSDVNFFDLLGYALNGGFPDVKRVAVDSKGMPHTDENGRKIMVPDVEATDAANYKLEQIKERFSQWVWEDQARLRNLTRIYNEKVNAYVKRVHKGDHLVFPGKVPNAIFDFMDHQKNAVWRFLQQGSVYFAHEVGTGKTFSIIGSVMEARRLGRAKKPIVAVQNATFDQYKRDWATAYPAANVLFAKIPKKEGPERSAILKKISSGDYDAIVVNHHSLSFLEVSPTAQIEQLRKEQAELNESLGILSLQGAGEETIRKISGAVARLEDRIESLSGAPTTNEVYFDNIGADMIVVDEAHSFKNLDIKTSYGNVKGIDSAGAPWSMNLYRKIQYIRNRYGKNIILASGTPLTNSVGELYTIARYVQPDMLAAHHLQGFDAWANTFGLISNESELTPTGTGYVNSTRFKSFVNIPELVNIFQQNVDLIRVTESKKEAQEKDEFIWIPRPKIKGGKPQTIIVPQSDHVKEFQRELVHRALALKNDRQAQWDGKQDAMTRMIKEGRTMAIDARLHDPKLSDQPDTKLNYAVKEIKRIYDKKHKAHDWDQGGKEYTEDKGVVLVFLDIGTPGGALEKRTKFSPYGDMKKKLIKAGIPEKEIAFIHDVPDKEGRRRLMGQVKEGKIRVLMGSTNKMGIGVNVQTRVAGILHVDVDWNYANYEQRNGRGLRYGNNIDEIEIINIGTAGTVDAFMWEVVARKAHVLGQVLSMNPNLREVEDISQDASNAYEYVSHLVDDKLAKKKVELDREVRILRNARSSHQAGTNRARFRAATIPEEIAANEANVEALNEQLEKHKNITHVQIGDEPFSLKKKGPEITKRIKEKWDKTSKATKEKLKKDPTLKASVALLGGEVKDTQGDGKSFVGNDIKIVIQWGPVTKKWLMRLDGEGVSSIMDDLGKSVSRLISRIKAPIQSEIDSLNENTQKLNDELPKIAARIDAPFEKEEEFRVKDAERRDLEKQLLDKQRKMEREFAEQQKKKGKEPTHLAVDEAPYTFSKRQMISAKRVAKLIPKWLRSAGLPKEVIDKINVKLQPFVDLTDLDIEQTLTSYGEMGVPVTNILGATTFNEYKAIMQLSLAMQNQAKLEETVIHEAWHIIKGWLMPKADIDAIGKHYRNEEEEARAFARFVLRYRNRLKGVPSPIRRIFMKIKRALQLIGNGLRGRGFTRPEDFFGTAMVGAYSRPHYVRGRTADFGGTTIALAGEPNPVPWASHQLIYAVRNNYDKMPRKVQSLKNWVRKQAKPSEIEWLDVDAIIDEVQKDGKVQPESLLMGLARNQVHLQEVLKTSPLDATEDPWKGEDIYYDEDGNVAGHPKVYEPWWLDYWARDVDELRKEVESNPNHELHFTAAIDPDMSWEEFKAFKRAADRPPILNTPNRYQANTSIGTIDANPVVEVKDGKAYVKKYEYFVEGSKVFESPDPRFKEIEINIKDIYEQRADRERPEITQYHGYTIPGGEGYRELLFIYDRDGAKWEHPHWSKENVLGWVRFDERVDKDGKKLLFIEEIQSDWLQRAKKVGFDEDDFEAAAGQRLEEIPKAPFLKNWHEVFFKRMLRYAAENGYDKIAWTTGDQQIARYPGVGKPEGLKVFYDERIPGFAKRYTKRWGAKYGKGSIVESNVEINVMPTSKYDKINKTAMAKFYPDDKWMVTIRNKGNKGTGNEERKFPTEEQARNYAKRKEDSLGANIGEVHHVSITPEMRESVMFKGQTWFNVDATREANEAIRGLNEVDPMTTIKDGYKGLFQSIDDRFGKGYTDNDMKVLRKILGLPYFVGKKFKSTEELVDTEIKAHERRAKELFDDYEGGLGQVQEEIPKDKQALADLKELIWGWNGKRMPRSHVPTNAINVPSEPREDLTVNENHYSEVRNYLVKHEGFRPDVVEAFLTIRRTLDRKLVDIDKTMRVESLDPDLIAEYRAQIGRIDNYFPMRRTGDSYVQIINELEEDPEKRVVYREHYNSLNRFKNSGKKVRARAEQWLQNAIADGIVDGRPQDFDISLGKVTSLPDEVFFQIPVEGMQKVAEEAGRRLERSRVKREAERLMRLAKKEGKELTEEQAYKKASNILRADMEKALSKAIAEVLKSRGWARHAIRRRGVPGHETEDIFGILHDYLAGYAGFKAKIWRARRHHETLSKIPAKIRPKEYEFNSKYVRDVLANQGKTDRIIDGLRSVFFVKYLGFVPKSGLINLTQNVVVAAPILSQYTKNPHRKLARAMKDARQALTTVEAWKGKTPKYASLTEEELEAVKALHEEGAVMDMMLRELKGSLPGSGWGKYWRKVVDKSGIFMQMAEKFNRVSTGLAAFRIAKNELGMGQAEAVEWAKKRIYDSHFLYGSANLPEWARGGDWQKYVRSAYTFRSFTHNYLSLMHHLLSQQTPETRRAFALSMRNLFIVGGLTSMPFFKLFADMLYSLLDWDEDDIFTDIRQGLPYDWTKDVVTYGLPGLLGWDLTGSLSIEAPSNWKDILGVPYAAVTDTINMAKSLGSGQAFRGLGESPFTPLVVRNIMRGIELRTVGARTRGGRDINVYGAEGPRKISLGEAIGKGFGIQPVSSTKAYAQYQAVQKLDTSLKNRTRLWADRYTNALRSNDHREMKKIMSEVGAWNASARRDGKYHLIIDIKRSVENRLKPGISRLSKKVRSRALEISKTWD